MSNLSPRVPEKSGEEEEMKEKRKDREVEEGDEGERDGESGAPQRSLDDDTREGYLGGAAAAEDDEGYHTPTSPEHSIPATPPCPPAPRKKRQRPRRRWWKLRVGGEEIDRAVRRRLHFSAEVELLFPIHLENPDL